MAVSGLRREISALFSIGTARHRRELHTGAVPTGQRAYHRRLCRRAADLTVMPGGEHWFHTEEQMQFLDQWLRRA